MKIFEWLLGMSAETETRKPPLSKLIKTELAIFYLSILRLIHRTIIYFLKIIVALMFIYLGLLFLLIALAIHSEYIGAMSWIVGIVFVLVPLIIISVLLSPKTWMKIFQIDKFLDDIK